MYLCLKSISGFLFKFQFFDYRKTRTWCSSWELPTQDHHLHLFLVCPASHSFVKNKQIHTFFFPLLSFTKSSTLYSVWTLFFPTGHHQPGSQYITEHRIPASSYGQGVLQCGAGQSLFNQFPPHIQVLPFCYSNASMNKPVHKLFHICRMCL